MRKTHGGVRQYSVATLLSLPFFPSMADAGQFSIIDDKDATVVYTGTWVTGGTTHEHAGTVSSSVKVGDSFLVPFTGTCF
jgi:hypothetical protein